MPLINNGLMRGPISRCRLRKRLSIKILKRSTQARKILREERRRIATLSRATSTIQQPCQPRKSLTLKSMVESRDSSSHLRFLDRMLRRFKKP